MLMQKKMGLLVTSVTLMLTIITFAPQLIPVAVMTDGSTQSENIVEPAPAPPGMLAYWEMNENGGSSILDSVSPYVNGYTSGNPSWITGIAGSGLQLLPNQFINFGMPPSFYAINYLTIEAWVNLPDTSGLHTILMNSYDSTHTMYNFAIEDGHLYFDRQSSGIPGNSFSSSATITVGEWHHIAVVMNSGSTEPDITFYIDKSQQVISGYNDYYSGPTGQVIIGADRATGTPSFLHGMIDEVAVYNSLISQSVMDEHYQKGLLGLGYLDDFPINVAPVAVDDSYIMDQDTVLPVDAPGVLGNDIDSDNDPLETDLVSIPSYGGLVLNPDGSFVYTPVHGFIGIDAFEYRAYDGVDYSTSATVTITVQAVNHPPVAEDDAYTTDEDVPLSITSPGVLANDHDVDPSDSIIAELVTGPQHGSLTLLSTGDFVYTPDPDWSGDDTFTYRVFDGAIYGNDALVTITVNPVNDAPVALDDEYYGIEDNTLVASSLLANDYDVDGDIIEINLVTEPSHGILTLDLDGSFTYVPDPDWSGTDSFTYELFDGHVYSNTATVTLTIENVNDAPVALDGMYTGYEDIILSATVPFATDAEGDTLQYFLVTSTQHGTLIFDSNGDFDYSPAADWFGIDSFTYYVFDGQEYSNIATITITIESVNDLPTAFDDAFSGTEDTVLSGNLLANDYDVEWDSHLVYIVDGPSYGVVDIDINSGVFTYIPNHNWFGVDSFTYYVFDGHVFSNVATVTLTIENVNDAPVALDGMYTGYANIVLSGAVPTATDADGDPVAYELVTNPSHGILLLRSDGTFDYSPDADWFGIDSFTYHAFDGTDYSNVATMTIEILQDDDITGPEITIIYSGDATDGSPGIWTVSVIDPESGVDWITIEIDGIIVGTTEGIYAVPNSLGEHTITVSAGNADLDYGPADQETSSLASSVTIVDDDTTGPVISIMYSGDATDGSPGIWTVSAIDPESGIGSITVEIDGIIVGTTAGPYAVPNSLGPHTITVTATNADLDIGISDQETTTLSHTITIVDDDVTPPSISIIYTGDMTNINPGFWTITVSDLESGIYSISVEIDGVAAGTLDGDYAVPGIAGLHSISVTAINNDVDRPLDQESSISTNSVQIEEITRPTEIIYTGDASGVYSDPVHLEALLLDASDQSPISGKTIMFTFGTQTAYAVTNKDGVASVIIILDQEEGLYKLAVSFDGDDDYLGSSSTNEFVIFRECALVIYSGVTLEEASEKYLTLSATVFDDTDGYWGDMSYIYVTFIFYSSSDPLTPVYVTYPVRVRITDIAGVGLVTLEIPNLPEGDYLLMVSLLPEHNRYYCSPDSETTLVSIYQPERAQAHGAGKIRTSDGHNAFFAFSVKYTCKGSLQGFLMYTYTVDNSVYLVKSCDIIGFDTDGTHAFFEANCTISGFNFKTWRIIGSHEKYLVRIDVFDNKRSPERDVFQIRIHNNLGLLEYEAGFEPFGYLLNGCIVVKQGRKY